MKGLAIARPVALACAGLFTAVPALAQTALVYESMDYPAGAGALHGKTAETGLGAWNVSPTGSGEIVSPGMTYTDSNGDSLDVKGNRFETRPLFNDLARAAIDTTNWSTANKNGGKLNKKGATIWFSALMNAQNTIIHNHFHLDFTDTANNTASWANGPGYFAVGKNTENTNWEIRGDNDDGDADVAATSTVPVNQDTFILGRISTDASGDSTMDVWFNPLLDDEASLCTSGDLSITVDANDDGSVPQFDRVGYRHQKWESPNLLDEIRMGESYDAVTPVAGGGVVVKRELVLLVVAAIANLGCPARGAIDNLRCEFQENPLGIDCRAPRLSWQIASGKRGVRQVAYHVLAASKPELLAQGTGDLWDSGKVKSDRTHLLPYAGKLPATHQQCFWKVRVSTSDGVEAESDVASWTMGFASPHEWNARWISMPAGSETSGTADGLPVFRKTFVIDGSLKRALVNVSGMGHFELFLNDRKVGERFLAPAWSVHEKTVYYDTHDLTDILKDGRNEFRIMLGKGFYNTQGDRRVHGVNSRGKLKTILEAHLEYADGRRDVVVTDESWDAATGPINHCAILAGSDFDAGAAEPTRWSKAAKTESPGALRAAESPPMAAFGRLSPVKPPGEPEPGVFVYDFGQNLSALPSVELRGQKGHVVRLTPAEQRHGQTDRHNNGTGRVNQAGVGSPNYYEYTMNGQGTESWQPQFTYGGFQYLEVTGAVPKGHPNPKSLPVLEAIHSVHVRSAAKQVGAFSCSNPLFVRIDEAIDRAVRSNLAHVLTDCPTREKLGWLEVAYLMGPSISRRYDLSRLYAKVTRDIRESQGTDGAMYTVAPNYPEFRGGFRYTPEWGAAGVVVPWQLYRWYGDKRVLQENLQAMKAFVDYMRTSSNDLVPRAGLGDWYDYGHGKGSGPAKFTPPELTAMATFYRCATIVSKTAEVLGQKEDAQTYRTLAERIRGRFNQAFYTGNGLYTNNGSPQTANAMALVTGLCEPQNEQAVLAAILADLKQRHYQQTAGDVGFHYLVEALGRYECHETVDTILNRRDEGSYGFIMDRGWTSLPEAWDANTRASMNHCMLGHIQQWFYCDLLGIRQAEDSVAFRRIIIKPAFDTKVEWAKGHYDAVPGRIGVDWKNRNGRLSLDVTIPPNTTATVHVPAKDAAKVTESGEPADQADGVALLRMEKGRAVFEVGSGSYAFTSTIKLSEAQ